MYASIRNYAALAAFLTTTATAEAMTGVPRQFVHMLPICSASSPQAQSSCRRLVSREQQRSRPAPWLSDAAKGGRHLLYVGLPFSSEIAISTISATSISPAGILSLPAGNAPVGLAVDRARDLYVAVTPFGGSAPASVVVFPPGSSQPSRTYTDGLAGTTPMTVAVDRHGTLYVATQVPSANCFTATGSGFVAEYAKGSMQPAALITDIPGCPLAVATDRASNLYVSYYRDTASNGQISGVREYARGSTHGSELGLSVPSFENANVGPLFWGLGIDSAGDIVVSNIAVDVTVLQLLTYPPGQTTPSNVIDYPGDWGQTMFALDGNTLYANAYIAEGSAAPPSAAFEYPSGRERVLEGQAAPGYQYGYAVSP
jgi:hypothetical protein